MKFSFFFILLLAGCCTSKETITIVKRDTVVSFLPSPVRVDTVIRVESSGSFHVSGYSPDSTATYQAGWDAASHHFTMTTDHKPIEKTFTIETDRTDTKVIKTLFIVILGYCACGALAMLGIGIAIKVGFF